VANHIRWKSAFKRPPELFVFFSSFALFLWKLQSSTIVFPFIAPFFLALEKGSRCLMLPFCSVVPCLLAYFPRILKSHLHSHSRRRGDRRTFPPLPCLFQAPPFFSPKDRLASSFLPLKCLVLPKTRWLALDMPMVCLSTNGVSPSLKPALFASARLGYSVLFFRREASQIFFLFWKLL